MSRLTKLLARRMILVRFLAIMFTLILCGSQPILAAPLSQAQKDTFSEGIYYFNTEAGAVCSSSSSSLTGTLPVSVPATYNTLFTNASAAAGINPQFLAAIFVTEHGNNWPNPAGPWVTSGSGASGPFQFMPITWGTYKTDGDGDGKMDVQNLADSAYSAAKFIKSMSVNKTSPLGTLEQPYQRQNLLYAAGAYNAGGGTMEMKTTPTSPVDAPGLSAETINYVKNVYYLITTGFAHGNPGYGNAAGTVADKTGGAPLPTSSSSSVASGDCSGAGAVQGNIVQTALNFAWTDSAHDFNSKGESQAKPAYVQAVKQYEAGVGSTEYTDCGVYVATVMRASGVDPNYYPSGTSNQLDYVKKHPEKYTVYAPGSWGPGATIQPQPGDIFITVTSGHTYLYVGKQSNGKAVAQASQGNHVPEVNSDNAYTQQTLDGVTEYFALVRTISGGSK